MYNTLLSLHSFFRWLVLASLVYAVFRGIRGWVSAKPFTRHDNAVRHWTATIAHIQLLMGLWLYFISPVVRYFLGNFSDAVHQRDVRFFGMEHSLMMLVSVIIITVGSIRSKRQTADQLKFSTMTRWYATALIVIFLSVPWEFSPLTSRPYFRPFHP